MSAARVAKPTCNHVDTAPGPLACTPRQLETAAAMCRAMSDPARLRLLVLLTERERCVSEIVAHDQSRLTSISARLQMLHAANLVARRREAKHVFYSLADEHVHLLLRNVLGHAAEKH
jgi:ArsR family transcriptional regulator, lead/cadmium/zinc/bismuth-responsive transcriptional repressor